MRQSPPDIYLGQKIVDNVLLTPVPFNLKLFLIHCEADLFTHEQRIIGLAVAGGETERNRKTCFFHKLAFIN